MLVLTHGLVDRPFSTALRARRAAPSMTDGLDVLVQDVMPATTTAPWSRMKSPCSSVVTLTGLVGRPSAPFAAEATAPAASSAKESAAGSDAGNDSSTASSSWL